MGDHVSIAQGSRTAPAAIAAVALAVMLAAILAASATAVRAKDPIIPPADVTRPPATKPFAADAKKLIEIGILRHGDTSLSPEGRSCNTCHAEADSYNPTFRKPWPHFVESVKAKTGLDRISAEGMVQFCMISAMGTRPLPWDSEALAGLTAFVLERHKKVVDK